MHKKIDQDNFSLKSWPIIFSMVKKIFHKQLDQENFPQSRKFSTAKEFSHKLFDQENFP